MKPLPFCCRLSSTLAFTLFVLGGLVCEPTLLHAHTGDLGTLHALDHTGGGVAFLVGFFHPLGGLDHLLAMIAVGLWAAQLGGRSLWLVPGCFVVAMVGGGMLGLTWGGFPGMESGIAASVLILGLCIALAVRLPWVVPAALVAVFAVCHGAAHGAELTPGHSALAYVGGFVLATASLHALGLAAGLFLGARAPQAVLRWAGAAVALVGGVLLGQIWLG